MKYARFIGILTIAIITVAVLWPHSSAQAGDPTNDQGTTDASQTTHHIESVFTEQNQSRLIKADPLPQLNDSQERKNLIERIKRLNDATHVGYVYLIGSQGQLMAYYTIKGKVTSLNSYLTTTQQIACQGSSNSYNCNTVDSPDLDGSYGKNPDGIFFFATDGRMVEWAGNYMYSDQPLNLTTKPILLQNGQ